MESYLVIAQWGLLILFGVLFLLSTKKAQTAAVFFRAEGAKGKQPGIFLLTSSLIISWIFAKSIANVANLSASYGWQGALAYSAYYLSFLVAGVVLYCLRVYGKFSSIHHFLNTRFGKGGVALFSILIIFRLLNEVWSNSMVIGSFFGEQGSFSYYVAILVFTLLTLAYVLKGGLKSSLKTDAVQILFFGVLITIILCLVFPPVLQNTWFESTQVGEGPNPVWSLFFVALLQVFSYPFHDPVMTDRAFLTHPKPMLISFVLACFFGFVFMFLFGFVGFYANGHGVFNHAAVFTASTFGPLMILVVNFIMITSAASTLDSSIASFSKLWVIDLKVSRKLTVATGRKAMVWFTVLGMIPLFFSPSLLSATTVSGTMVIGLAPAFLCWKLKAPPISFYTSVGSGLIVGVLLVFNAFPQWLVFSNSHYGELLWANIWATIFSFALYLGFYYGKR